MKIAVDAASSGSGHRADVLVIFKFRCGTSVNECIAFSEEANSIIIFIISPFQHKWPL